MSTAAIHSAIRSWRVGCCHYHDHFYALLVRTDLEKRFVADPLSLDAFSGTYIDNRQWTLIFHVAEDCLFLNVPWRGREIPGLALDERRFVYKDFGRVAFQSAQDDTLLVVEWWNQVFRHNKVLNSLSLGITLRLQKSPERVEISLYLATVDRADILKKVSEREIPWTAQFSHLHLLEGHHELLTGLVPVL